MKYIVAFLMMVACAGAAILVYRYQRAGREVVTSPITVATPAPTPESTPLPPLAPAATPATAAPAAPAPEPDPAAPPVETPRPTPAPTPAPERTGPLTDAVQPAAYTGPVPHEMRRLALAYVGSDAEAEEIWFESINDPNVSAHDRSDLIEDLNETGFMDPKNIQIEELPIVLKRLAIIEELAPYAMDKTNADAFAEAYKDLVNIYNRLAGNQ